MSYITAIGTAVPEFRFDQSTICRFMESTMARGDEHTRRKIKAVFRASGIQSRHSVLDDYGRTESFTFYPNNLHDPFPGTERRMKIFRDHSLPLSKSAVMNMMHSHPELKLAEVTHLIVVSCTGMYAPGLDIDLVKALPLSPNVQRICIQFMGCYAAFNALKIADAICRNTPHQKVLIVCTELCSIHFQQRPSDDNLLANALFADGSAAMTVESERSTGKAFAIESYHSELALHGEKDMAWNIGDHGFQMQLSSYVPDLIREEIRNLTNVLLTRLKKKRENIRFFAPHPGGIKILQTIDEQLGLNKSESEEAYRVLKNFGNMSSATVVFVLNEIMKKVENANNNDYVLSVGFGPGLTLESMLLQIKTE
jgi:prepilin-type processing-associated H-X9-DG protein